MTIEIEKLGMTMIERRSMENSGFCKCTIIAKDLGKAMKYSDKISKKLMCDH